MKRRVYLDGVAEQRKAYFASVDRAVKRCKHRFVGHEHGEEEA